MIGRAAYQTPELLIGVDPELFGDEAPVADGFEAIEAFMPAIARGLERGERLHDFTRHLHGLFAGRPGALGASRERALERGPIGGRWRARASAPAPASTSCAAPSPSWSEGGSAPEDACLSSGFGPPSRARLYRAVRTSRPRSTA